MAEPNGPQAVLLRRAKELRDEQIHALTICDCAYPEVTNRNGSGHAHDCPTHVEFIKKTEAMVRKAKGYDRD